MGARRPLVGPRGEILGYEFHLGPAQLRRLQARSDAGALQVHLETLFSAMRLCAQSGHIAYAELPAQWLTAVRPDGATPLQIRLLVATDSPDASTPFEALSDWLDAGASLGWSPADGAQLALGGLPNFSVGQPLAGAADIAWVAPHLPDIDALEDALQRGAAWASCQVLIGAQPRTVTALPPQARHLMQLLSRLVRDEEVQAVVAEIKCDAVLAVRLLQYLNSPGVSRGFVLESIEQAVAVLGRDALYHWASALLVRMAPAGPATPSLQALALARARLLELLARAAGEPNPGSLYLMGLGSVLPLLLRTSLAEALATLRLPLSAESALLQRQGPWAGYLALVEALEVPDLVTAAALAGPVGGMDQVMSLAARAWLPD